VTDVASTREELKVARESLVQHRGGPVAVVMTMGALHDGHVELIRQAQGQAGIVIVTDFLNPLQFAPGEDLDKYPRTFESDLRLCRAEGVDLMFAPTVTEVYPDEEPLIRVEAGPVGDVLEGYSRPGHFDGVLTVVAKLLHLTRPDLALFGRKDAQQLWLIERMVRDLDFPVRVIAVSTVRDGDGLALSSRNSYLDAKSRRAALALPQALDDGLAVAQESSGTPSQVVSAARTRLDHAPGVDADYVALVDPATFQPVTDDFRGDALLLVAARVGQTRLIDNSLVTIKGGEPRAAGH